MADFNFYLNRQGVRGNKGEQGEQGFSPYISVNTNTANEYTLDVTNESGTFTTPNLRGNAIEDEGGTYIRYNPETKGMYTGYADTASTTQQGEVTLSTPENLAAGGDGTVPTSGDVFDFVENKISEASVNYVDIEDYTQKMAELDGEINTLDTDKLDFSDLADALTAGTNITIVPNSTTGKITISGEPVDQAQADWDEADSTEPSYIKNKPTIPASQIQSDWEQADSSALDYIKNKPVIDGELSSTSTNAVQNRLVTNAINLISNNMENLADKDLSNLTSAGNSRLRALKSYEDAGELLTDSEGLVDVTKYAHSTFDSTKFTAYIHGTPTITSDGLMYGNYDNSIGSGLDMDTTLIVVGVENRIKMKYTYAKAGVSGFAQWLAFIRFDSSSNSYGISIREDNTINVVINASNNQVPASTLSLTEKQSYGFEIISDFKTYLKVNVDGTEVYSNTSLGLTYTACSMFRIGNNVSWQGTRYNVGAIDLKYLEITNDNIPVFNGNRTGIDTIKPDDYTVVGTPTISADGVATNLINKSITLPIGSISGDFDFEFQYTTADAIQTTWVLYNTGIFAILQASWGWTLSVYANNSAIVSANFGSSQTVRRANPVANTKYKFKFSRYGDTYTLGIQAEDEESMTTTTVSNFTALDRTSIIIKQNSDNTYSFTVDLNKIHLFVDGNLVYQPCLKIPYTLSKTGSKVVNSIYRDRVNDMASQFGSANYYTLDEDNGNFTLPRGELYGLIENATTAIPSGVVQSPSITNIVSLTQAEYDLIVPESDTLYIITPSS